MATVGGGWGGGFHKTALPHEDQKGVSPFLRSPPPTFRGESGRRLWFRYLEEWTGSLHTRIQPRRSGVSGRASAACEARNALCGRGSRESPRSPLPRSELPFGARALLSQIAAPSRRGNTPPPQSPSPLRRREASDRPKRGLPNSRLRCPGPCDSLAP